jgi:hypothetical protein
MEKQVPFTFSNHTILLDIPNRISINEHTYRLIDQWNLPIFVFPSKSSLSFSSLFFGCSR